MAEVATAVAFARLSGEPLDLAEHLEAVSGPRFGAVVNFVGQIRDHDPDAPGPISRLEYTAHPDARRVIEEIALRVISPDVRLAVSHRVGLVAVGEPALLACVAAAHRAEAYEVSRELIETIKADLPIWKRQIGIDGNHNWQGLN